jgi:hypothetical protein
VGVAVWATDSFHGLPAGVVHRNADDGYGRPGDAACGASTAGLWYFASVDVADVPPTWRCPDCGTGGDDSACPA